MTRPPHVLSVAYPLAEAGPSAAGGAEQILSQVEAAAVAHGYTSHVAAHAHSTVVGRLFGVEVTSGVLTDETRAEAERGLQRAIDAAVQAQLPDLIHMHGIDFHRYALPADVPVLVTLHLPPAWYPAHIWQLPPRYTLQCVSPQQRLACRANVQSRLAVIENGVAQQATATPTHKQPYALLLSRICPEKNLHTAIAAATAAGVPVVLAGKLFAYPEHVDYFEQQIKPLLGADVRFVGPVAGEQKQQLLREARCLLIPSLAEETSSLVAMESLAAGTPVVAMHSGALPTIVQHGVTGFIVTDGAGMQAALARVDRIDPATCRTQARERFSLDRMTSSYMHLYERLLS